MDVEGGMSLLIVAEIILVFGGAIAIGLWQLVAIKKLTRMKAERQRLTASQQTGQS